MAREINKESLLNALELCFSCLEQWRYCMLQAPPEPKYVPFKGQGHTLGTKLARLEDNTSLTNTNDTPRPSQGLVIDDAKPATSIQVMDLTLRLTSSSSFRHKLQSLHCYHKFHSMYKVLAHFCRVLNIL